MNILNPWLRRFLKGLKQASDEQPKNECRNAMQYLKDSFDAKSFDAFNKIISQLMQKATQKNREAMDMLIYLKQQANPAYRQIICLPQELSRDIHFTQIDFERLVGLYQEQKAAREEESLI